MAEETKMDRYVKHISDQVKSGDTGWPNRPHEAAKHLPETGPNKGPKSIGNDDFEKAEEVLSEDYKSKENWMTEFSNLIADEKPDWSYAEAEYGNGKTPQQAADNYPKPVPTPDGAKPLKPVREATIKKVMDMIRGNAPKGPVDTKDPAIKGKDTPGNMAKKVKKMEKCEEAKGEGGPWQQSAYRQTPPGEIAAAVKKATVQVRKRIADKQAKNKK